MTETNAEFLDRLEATPRYNPAYRTLDSDRLFALARRGAAAADRIAQLEAALRPLACTCKAKHQADCSRAEVNCAFWNARAALEASDGR